MEAANAPDAADAGKTAEPASGDPASGFTPDVPPPPEPPPPPADPTRPQPDLARTGAALQSLHGRSRGITILAALALLYTLYFAREFLRPIAFALLLNFLFSPLVRALARRRIRPPVGAALVIATLLAVGGLAIYELAVPVQNWAARLPETVRAVQADLAELLRPVERVTRTAEQVESATSSIGGGAQTQVVVRGPSLISRLFGTTQHFVFGVLEVGILLYFLLAAGDLFLQKLMRVLPDPHSQRKAVDIARATESSISTYLVTAALINVAEGVAVAGTMYLLGMPNPLLWGALASVLEFIPYLGAAVMTAILTAAAFTIFDSTAHALLVPTSFLAINVLQANLLNPLLLGHRLALNPVAILVGLAFWFWVWGIPGAFIAVPLLAAFKIVCDHIEALAPIGEFLGPRAEDERRAIVRQMLAPSPRERRTG